MIVSDRTQADVMRAFLQQLRQLHFEPKILCTVGPESVVRCISPFAILLDMAFRDFHSASALQAAVRGIWEYTPIILIIDEREVDLLRFDGSVHDFITLPIPLPTLDARLRFSISRVHGHAALRPDPISAAGLQMNPALREVTINQRPIALTYKEFELLRFFLTHPRRVYTRAELLLAVWETEDYGDTRTVDMHIRRLRLKLGSNVGNMIHTIRNVGYRFG